MTDPADEARPEGRRPEDPTSADRRAEADESDESDVERAREIYEEVGAENPDPITRREAVEGELEDEGLSEAGGAVGEHNE
jgi:hypothetical protein